MRILRGRPTSADQPILQNPYLVTARHGHEMTPATSLSGVNRNGVVPIPIARSNSVELASVI